VQDVTAADRVAGDHRHDRLRHAANLDVQVGHMEAANRRLSARVLAFAARSASSLAWIGGARVIRLAGAAHVAAALAAHALVAPRAERVRALAGENHHADSEVLADPRESVGELDHRLGSKRVADLGAVDRDLRDPGVGAGRALVADVLVLARRLPRHGHAR
jgi:hypothetical protein